MRDRPIPVDEVTKAKFNERWKSDRTATPPAMTVPCWRWMATINPRSGYGQVYLRPKGETRGSVFFAHRASYEMHVGPVPDEWVVDHLCKNKWCVNPQHLEAVSKRENALRYMEDPPADNDRARKLYAAQVTNIKRRLEGDEDAGQIAADFGVTPGQIEKIADGTYWSHVEAAAP